MADADLGYSTTLVFNHRRALDLGIGSAASTVVAGKKPLLRRILNALESGIGGGAPTVEAYELFANKANAPVHAATSWLVSSGAGTVGLTVGGVALTATWATSDTASAALVLAVVNASSNALIQNVVRAGLNKKGTVACATCVAGDRVDICGYRFTGRAGTPVKVGEFSIDTSDTATAASLAAAINRTPGLNQRYMAYGSSGNCFLLPFSTAAVPAADTIKAFAATITATQLTAGAEFAVYAAVPGVLGNHITTAASGTGVTVKDARMISGEGANVLRVAEIL